MKKTRKVFYREFWVSLAEDMGKELPFTREFKKQVTAFVRECKELITPQTITVPLHEGSQLLLKVTVRWAEGTNLGVESIKMIPTRNANPLVRKIANRGYYCDLDLYTSSPQFASVADVLSARIETLVNVCNQFAETIGVQDINFFELILDAAEQERAGFSKSIKQKGIR